MISKVNLLTADTTEQEVFDYVCQHLADQKGPCSEKDHTGETHCKYRHDGKACAIGSLFPDELYNPAMEGTGANSLVTEFFPDAGHLKELCDSLQHGHDSAMDLVALKHRLQLTAEMYGLKPDKIELIKEWFIDGEEVVKEALND